VSDGSQRLGNLVSRAGPRWASDAVSAGPDPLGLDVERLRALGHLLVDRLADHRAALADTPVVRCAPAEQLERRLGGPLPEGAALDDLESLLELLAVDGLGNMQLGSHPRFFARVPSPASGVAILAEWLATGMNSIAASWGGGSGPTQLELISLRWLAQLLGLEQHTEGVLVSGGSIGNLTALVAARHAGYTGRVLVSDQTHASVTRALRIGGWTDEQLCLIPARDRFRWRAEDVEAALEPGDQGRAVIIATAGTTNTGAVDPLAELGELAQRHDLWLHVDGAYGAPAAACQAGRAALAGLERADSLTLDPHKWLFCPYDIGAVLMRRPGVLEACYGMAPEYLRDVTSSATGEVDLRNRSPELSRRARGAKLWLTLRAHGRRAIVDAIARGIELAEQVQALLEADRRWEVVSPAQLAVICFADRQLDGEAHFRAAHAVSADGFASLGCTELAGRTVYRLCLINPATTLQDVSQTLALLRAAAERDGASAVSGGQG
jgi:aromatic-L-amino-acid decarboxylase